jgi:hypothetical protein
MPTESPNERINFARSTRPARKERGFLLAAYSWS